VLTVDVVVLVDPVVLSVVEERVDELTDELQVGLGN
jgi:hypothetical protein